MLDGLAHEVVSAEPFLRLLVGLLKSARVRTLLTMREPVAQPLQGGAEKVIQLPPLSAETTARLLCRQPDSLDPLEECNYFAPFKSRFVVLE